MEAPKDLSEGHSVRGGRRASQVTMLQMAAETTTLDGHGAHGHPLTNRTSCSRHTCLDTQQDAAFSSNSLVGRWTRFLGAES